MHTALASVAECALGGGGLIDDTLLHDGAVHGEAVRRGLGGFGGGGGDQSFEDGVLFIVRADVAIAYDLLMGRRLQ